MRTIRGKRGKCLRSLIVVAIAALATGTQAVLPSETTLPGTPFRAVDLPGEDTLPSLIGDGSRRSALPGENALPSTVTPDRGESRLPDEVDADDRQKGAGDEAVQEESVGKERERGTEGAVAAPPLVPDKRPWLRLNFPGHIGQIRSLSFTSDSTRLFTAGDDKTVHVWRLREEAARGPQWTHREVIRWQVQRGPRGRIHAIATGGGLLAFGGRGAMGSLGEIILVDAATGQWNGPLQSKELWHRAAITDLSMSTRDEQTIIASSDVSGRVLVWRKDIRTGIFQPIELVAADTVVYGKEVAETLRDARRISPVEISGDMVFAPVFVPESVNANRQTTEPLWTIEQFDVVSREKRRLGGTALHRGAVRTMAVSPDGRRLASADAWGNLFLWDLKKDGPPVRFQQNAQILSLDFGTDGRFLLIGTYRLPAPSTKASVRILDLLDPARPVQRFETTVDSPVEASGISPDGKWFAYSDGSAVVVSQLASPNSSRLKLRVPIRRPRRVAFPKQRPFYRVAFGTEFGRDGRIVLDETFDPSKLQLGVKKNFDQREWLRADYWKGAWDLPLGQEKASLKERENPVFWLFKYGRRAARLPLNFKLQGAPTAVGWIPDARGKPLAVAVGTSVQNNIYVYRLADRGVCPILRVFRGHGGPVTSVGLSFDRRYLASASRDATIRIWKLSLFDNGDPLLNRWGTLFDIQNAQLVATDVRPDGPLYSRGLRTGDVVTRLTWSSGNGAWSSGNEAWSSGNGAWAQRGEDQSTKDAAEMLTALRELPWNRMTVFYSRRGRQLQPPFQKYPAWGEVASLFVAENREWAYWTPSGYYDASFEGHKLFGWQVNRRTLQLPPDFFLAAQFRRTLERPDVMRRLLDAGNLVRAFELAHSEPPVRLDHAVADQYRLKPEIELLSPESGFATSKPIIRVAAAIRVPSGEPLASVKIFANGVVAKERRLLGQETVRGVTEYRYEWKVALPSEPEICLQAVAATEAEAFDIKSRTIRRIDLPNQVPRRMFVFAAGINQYRDARIGRLNHAAPGAKRIADVFRDRAWPLYQQDGTILVNHHATRPVWTAVAAAELNALKTQVSPDDLVVIFLSGHGMRDESTGEYYYITSEADYSDLMAGRFGDCVSFGDLAAFGELPCRKLVVLDTCHSGAASLANGLGQRNLKAAIRALQDDLVLTLTASEGNQEAVDGRFSARLIEALEGRADAKAFHGNEDGVVTLDEAIRYVQTTVAEDSAADNIRQHPTAGPSELLPFVRLPLTR